MGSAPRRVTRYLLILGFDAETDAEARRLAGRAAYDAGEHITLASESLHVAHDLDTPTNDNRVTPAAY